MKLECKSPFLGLLISFPVLGAALPSPLMCALWLSSDNPVTLYGAAMWGDAVPRVSAWTQRYQSLPQTLLAGFHSAL